MTRTVTPRLLWLVLPTAVAVVGLTLLLTRRSAGVPSYGGKTLRQWLLQVHDPLSGNMELERQEAFGAFGKMDSNVVPFLASVFTAQDAEITRQFAAAYRELYLQAPADVRGRLPKVLTAEDLRTAARAVCSHLPPEQRRSLAEQVVPELCARVVDDRRSAAERESLLVGPIRDLEPRVALVTATLIGALQDREPVVRRAAAFRCMEYGEHAKETVPELLKTLEDSDAGVRLLSARALSSMGRLPDDSGVVLRRALEDPYLLAKAPDSLTNLARNNALEFPKPK